MNHTVITIELALPTPPELERIVTEWFDAAPMSTVYAVFEGDGPSDGEDLSPAEQERVFGTAVRYMWLRAARKRLEKP